MYFGIEDETKVHRLYDRPHEKIHMSKNIVFEEENKLGLMQRLKLVKYI